MSNNKRHLSSNPEAVRTREKRHRQAQEKEMMQNEIDSLKNKVRDLQSIIKRSFDDCTCDAKSRSQRRIEAYAPSIIAKEKNENNAEPAPPPSVQMIPIQQVYDNGGDPDDEVDEVNEHIDDDSPQRTEAAARNWRFNRARTIRRSARRQRRGIGALIAHE